MIPKLLRLLAIFSAAGVVAAPVPGSDLGSCTKRSLERADVTDYCRYRYRTLCRKAQECGLEAGVACNNDDEDMRCGAAFCEGFEVAERDALHCIELLQELPCDDVVEPVWTETNIGFCDFCDPPEE